jgi:murein DD-endopeptidase MepM/ murein hydrolase activator NlpD
MSVYVEPPRARAAMRFAAFAMVAAGLAGCSGDVARFERGPSFALSSNTPPADMTGSVRPAQAAPAGRVESRPLPPSGAAQGGYQQSALPPSQQTSQPGAYEVPPPRKLAPPPQTASAPPSSKKGGVHVVTSGETLGSLANKYRMSRGEIARANGMKATDQVRIGQRLTIPGVEQSRIRGAAAPAEPAKPARTAEARPDPKAAAKEKTVQRGAPPANLSADKPPAPERVERAALAQPAATAGDDKDGPAAAGGAPSFRWPARGRVIAGFGPKAGGQQNDGINLAVPEGTSVKAAEDGVVAYSGNELKGYGNLVLVRHPNGYVTAYAHASELKVKRGDKVKRGQIIALAGQTGSVNAPQLHFEVRKGSTPVDPMPYLTGN